MISHVFFAADIAPGSSVGIRFQILDVFRREQRDVQVLRERKKFGNRRYSVLHFEQMDAKAGGYVKSRGAHVVT
jgi:hypothetical protein